MTSEIIKFRVPVGHKELFSKAARDAGMTISELLRRAARAAVAGRIASRPVLLDLVYIRSMANRLDALAAVAGDDVVGISIKDAAETLRAIARRHLEAGR
jgi:hypothetical protein